MQDELTPTLLEEFLTDKKGLFWEGEAIQLLLKYMKLVVIEVETLKVENRTLRVELERKIDLLKQ